MRSKFEISNKSLLLKFNHNIKFLIYINLKLFDIVVNDVFQYARRQLAGYGNWRNVN